MRLRSVKDFESYIEKIDEHYDGDDVIFTGQSIEFDMPEFKPVKRSNYGEGSNYLTDIEEYRGVKCFIPTGNNCFLKCINYLTGKDYKKEYFEFIANEDRRRNVMTTARIQPFVTKYEIDIGIFNGKQILPKTVKERRKCLYLYKNHFCVIWGNSLSKAVKEVEANFKFVNTEVTQLNSQNFKEYKFDPKKIDSQVTNVCVYDIETFNRDRAVPYAIGYFLVSKMASSKYNKDLTEKEIDSLLNNVRIFDGEDCITKMFEKLRDLKGEPKKIEKNGKKITIEYEMKMIAHNGSGFDSWIILDNLPEWCRITSMIKTGKGIINMKIYNGMCNVKTNKERKIVSKGQPQYLVFNCSANHMKSSLRKLGETYKLQKEVLKQEIDHTEIYEDTWEAQRDIWEPYLRMDILTLAIIYARYSLNMESITGFGMKDCLSLPSLGWKYFNSKRDQPDLIEPIYTYTDKYMRHFVRQAIKGGKVGAFNQIYESKISDNIFDIIKFELKTNGNKYEIIEVYTNYIKDFKKKYGNEYDSKFDDYRDIKQKAKDKYVNEKLSELPISKKLQDLNRDDLLMAFDATSLYPSAMVDGKYPKIETGYAFTKDMSSDIVNQFNSGKTEFASAILKVKYYNPKDLVIQHLPVKEEVNKIEVNSLRNGYIIYTLTSVDIEEIAKIGGKIIEIYEGVIYRENFEVSPFKDFVNNLFELRAKCKSEGEDILQEMVKLIMNSLYGQTIRKDIEEEFCCKTEHWMKTEFDERVKDYWKLANGNYTVKLALDEGIDKEIEEKNKMPSHLGAFILSNSKRIMNKFVTVIDGFKTNNVYYQDTDSLYIEKKYWNLLDNANLVGDKLGQGKNDYGDGGIFYGLFLAPKIKYCLTINEYGIINDKKTFKGFGDINRLLDTKKYFDTYEGKPVEGKFPLSWKKSFDSGFIIPCKTRDCDSCNGNELCEECDSKVRQNKKFQHNIIELKREPADKNGIMKPYYVI